MFYNWLQYYCLKCLISKQLNCDFSKCRFIRILYEAKLLLRILEIIVPIIGAGSKPGVREHRERECFKPDLDKRRCILNGCNAKIQNYQELTIVSAFENK